VSVAPGADDVTCYMLLVVCYDEWDTSISLPTRMY